MDAFDNIGKKDNWSDPHANASMAQLQRERKEQAAAKRAEELRLKEKILAEANKPQGEGLEERAARLKAQRDLLRKQKEEKRQAELNEFNSKLES